MHLNDDFTQRAVVHAARLAWVPSPMPGVDRRMLDRIGDEVARATSIVRYAPGSAFSPHVHDGGEEFLVLDGVFSDESGDFPAGYYVRNPPTSRHTPASAPGCTILVKLHQFDPDDRCQVRLPTNRMAPVAAAGRDGVAVLPLFADDREEVRLEVWAPGTAIDLPAPGGLELLVLEGGFATTGPEPDANPLEGPGPFAVQSWLRLPPGDALRVRAGATGARVWLKSGHLAGLR